MMRGSPGVTGVGNFSFYITHAYIDRDTFHFEILSLVPICFMNSS